MSLIKCPECKKDVSNTTNACIHCGYNLRKYKTVLRYFLGILCGIFLLVIMVFPVAGILGLVVGNLGSPENTSPLGGGYTPKYNTPKERLEVALKNGVVELPTLMVGNMGFEKDEYFQWMVGQIQNMAPAAKEILPLKRVTLKIEWVKDRTVIGSEEVFFDKLDPGKPVKFKIDCEGFIPRIWQAQPQERKLIRERAIESRKSQVKRYSAMGWDANQIIAAVGPYKDPAPPLEVRYQFSATGYYGGSEINILINDTTNGRVFDE